MHFTDVAAEILFHSDYYFYEENHAMQLN